MTALAFVPVDPIEGALCRLGFFRRAFYRVQTDFEADLCEWFGFRPAQARIAAVLYFARGPILREALLYRAEIKANTLRVEFPRVREALGEDALHPLSEGTYQMTQLGRAACDEAVEQVGIGRLRKELAA